MIWADATDCKDWRRVALVEDTLPCNDPCMHTGGKRDTCNTPWLAATWRYLMRMEASDKPRRAALAHDYWSYVIREGVIPQ